MEGGLEDNATVEVELKLSCGGAASAWLMNVNDADDEEEGLRYRKWYCFGLLFMSLSGCAGRSNDERAGEALGEPYAALIVALLPGMGRGRLW